MTSLPESFAADLKDPDPALLEGVAALAQEDYLSALAFFDQARRARPKGLAACYSHMGLVVAYERYGQPEQAIRFCLPLTRISHPEIRTWATQVMTDFTLQYPQLILAQEGESIAADRPKDEGENGTIGNSPTLPPIAPVSNTAETYLPNPEAATIPPIDSTTTAIPASAYAFGSTTPLPTDNTAPHSRMTDGSTQLPSPSHRSELEGMADSASFCLLPLPLPQPNRAQVGKPLSKPRRVGFSLVLMITVVVCFSLTLNLSNGLLNTLFQLLQSLTFSPPVENPIFTFNRFLAVAIGCLFLWGPWLLQALLQQKLARDDRDSGLAIVKFLGCLGLFFLSVNLVNSWILWAYKMLQQLPFMNQLELFPWNQIRFINITLGLLIGASPWILDLWLSFFHNAQPLQISTLSQVSPEAVRRLSQFARQRRIPLPQLLVLPTSAPMIFTYGHLPRTARIVVSQGALTQLTDEELATLYAREVGHIVHWDFLAMTIGLLFSQIPYLIYWQTAEWGDRWLKALPNQGQIAAIFSRGVIYLLASLSMLGYGLWYVLRASLLWLSRWRSYYSDRVACELTGNPNALVRALLKVARGIAADIQQQEQTSYLLESVELLLPIGPNAALPLGSLRDVGQTTTLEEILDWDRLNPYRWWLSLGNAHPPNGARLYLLHLYAQSWQLKSELAWPKPALNRAPVMGSLIDLPIVNLKLWLKTIQDSRGLLPHLFTLTLQYAPWFGLPLGFAIGWLIRGVAWIIDLAGFRSVGWLVTDKLIFQAALCFGLTLAIFLWINSFYPEIKRAPAQFRVVAEPDNPNEEPNLAVLLHQPYALPSGAQTLFLKGKLLGRSGLANVLGQDLVLQTSSGLIRLYHIFQFGPLFEIWFQSSYPAAMVKKSLQVTGWFRRSAFSWLDLETMRTSGGMVSYSSPPVWLTLWGAIFTLIGLNLIRLAGQII